MAGSSSRPAPGDAHTPPAPRNPGPTIGFRVMRTLDRVLPEVVYRPLRVAGTWVALVAMPRQRRHSRAYLRVVLGREPGWRDLFQHFFAFEESLMLKLRVIDGRDHSCRFDPVGGGFAQWMEEGFPVLLGTFHVGVSDLLGFLLGGKKKRQVHLVRLRVGNSDDTEALLRRFGDQVKVVWINEPADMLFALKEAASAPGAIALQCDRVEFSSRTEVFDFLGARRVFPFTLYHLARLFGRPVVLTVGLLESAGHSILHDSPVFWPIEGESPEAARLRAREHFQAFLSRLEALLRKEPWVWFNFTPLPPEAAPPRSAAR